MLTNLHPELNENTHKEIQALLMSLARDARGTTGRLRREDLLVAAQLIGETLKPPVEGSVVLQFMMSGITHDKAPKKKAVEHSHTADLGERKITIAVKGNTPRSEIVKRVVEPAPTPPAIKGQVVSGDDDPFNAANRSLYKDLVNELNCLQVGQTIGIPADNWEHATKMRELLHGVSRKLNWTPVIEDGVWRSYLVTIKDMKVFVHRLG
jgi:hypothetical protein